MYKYIPICSVIGTTFFRHTSISRVEHEQVYLHPQIINNKRQLKLSRRRKGKQIQLLLAGTVTVRLITLEIIVYYNNRGE